MQLKERIEALVADVERRWEAESWSRATFPELAEAALVEAAFAESVQLDDWLDYVLSRADLPRQVDPFNAFGEPPVTLAFRERFAVDLYFWHQPVVDVHNHSFDGAFAVVEGTSLHSHYTFLPDDEEAVPVRLGEVRRDEVELLPRGAVRPIRAGVELIHQVAHLSSPCVSLVLRTHPDATDPPIYTYLPPRAAILQRRYLTEVEHKQLALVPLLLRVRPEHALQRLAPMLDRGGDLMLAWALRLTSEATQEFARARTLAARLSPRPWLADFLDSAEATDTLEVRWETVPRENHRFVLALSRAASDRATRERVAREYWPGRGYDALVENMVREMSSSGMFGAALPDLAFGVLRALLAGADDEEAIAAALPDHGLPEVQARALMSQLRAYFLSVPLLRRLVGHRDG